MEGQLQLGLIEYSMRLDQALAVASDTVREFEDTLVAELSELQTIADLLREKSQFISGQYPELLVEPMVKGMTALTDEFKGLLPGKRLSLPTTNEGS